MAVLLRKQGRCFEDVSATELRREETMRGWRGRLTDAELTRAVFGDPRPGRVARG
jgi:hypothetical protein